MASNLVHPSIRNLPRPGWRPGAARPARSRAGSRMALGDWGALGLLSVFWGSGTYFNELAVQGFGPMSVAVLRVALAALVLGAAMRLCHVPCRVQRCQLRLVAVMGLCTTALPSALIAWGITRLDSGLAGILLATTPIFTALIAHVATRDERLGVARAAGFGLGMLGVVVTIGGNGFATGDGLACLAILGAALAYGIGGVYGRGPGQIEPLALAQVQLVAATLMLAPVAVLVDRPWQAAGWSWTAAWGLAGLAVPGTAARAFVYYRLLATVGATRTSLVGFLIPLTSLGMGVLLLGERVSLLQVTGMGFVIVGMLAIDGRLGHLRSCHRLSHS